MWLVRDSLAQDRTACRSGLAERLRTPDSPIDLGFSVLDESGMA
jgi:hypothetical protein